VQLDVLVNFGLLATVLWEYWCMLAGCRSTDIFGLEQYDIHIESIVQSAFAGQYAVAVHTILKVLVQGQLQAAVKAAGHQLVLGARSPQTPTPTA
jgi:hypothetical protein